MNVVRNINAPDQLPCHAPLLAYWRERRKSYMLSAKHGGQMPYSVAFFKDKKEHGWSPGHKDLASAKNFAAGALIVNGADSFAIYEDGSEKPAVVFTREPDAKGT